MTEEQSGEGFEGIGASVGAKRSSTLENGIEEMLTDELTQLSIRENTLAFFEQVCREVFKQKRDYLVHRFTQQLCTVGTVASDGAGNSYTEQNWVGIESLSRLRSVVGGRFQNLKKRWMKAGLPLKEHRGDQNLEFTLNEEGWVELTNWILKQGYEARLTDIQTGYLFELRPLGD